MNCENEDCRKCGRATCEGSRYDYVKRCWIRTYDCLIGNHDREYLEYDNGREEVIKHY